MKRVTRTGRPRTLATALAVALAAIACASSSSKESDSALSAAATAAGTPAWLQPPPPPKEAPVVRPGALHDASLDNGLRVMVLEDRRLPLAVVGVTLPRGAAIESLEEAGLASFTTELMQQGAGEWDALALASVVDDIGASLVVSSSWDSSSVVVVGLERDLDRLLEILATVLLEPRFDPAEAERVRAEQRATLVRARDEPGTLVSWHALATLYPEHRFGVPAMGTNESVQRLDAEAARNFHGRVFTPDGAIFFAAGDVKADRMRDEASRRFGAAAWPSRERTAVSPAPPERVPTAREIVVIDRPDLAQARIVVTHEGLARSDDDRVGADLMNKVLGGSGFASRLMQRVRADEGLTYSVSSGFDLRRHPGPFRISTFTRASETRRVVDLLLAEMERIRSEPPSEDELARAKSLAVGRFGLSLESSEAVLASLVDLAVYDLPADSLDTYRSRVRAIDTAETKRLANLLIHPDRAAIVVLGPAEVVAPQLEDLGEVRIVQP